MLSEKEDCAVATNYQEIADRYGMMNTDDLLRLGADRAGLTTAADGALLEELRKRGLDSPDAIQRYQRDRAEKIGREEEQDAAVRWANRSRFQRIFDYLKQHPIVAILASIAAPGFAFVIGYGIVTLRVGNGRILSVLVSLTLVLGGLCGIAAGRSSAVLPIRVLGFLATLADFFYAFVFLFAATIGFR
jgi:hypothetical protein